MRKALPALLLILSAASLLSQAGGVVTYLTDGAATPKDEVKSATSSSARFSPDGTRVVFITHADNFTGPHKFFKITQVAELEIATGKVTYITDGDYYQSEPSYSPDGNRIVFRTESQNFGKVKNKFDKKGMRPSQIAEWDRSTGKVKYLTDGDAWSDFPEYSPDGDRVVFQTRAGGYSGKFSQRQNEWGDPEQQIAEWDRKTGKVTYLVDGDGESSRPHYCPDGKRIVFGTGALNLASPAPGRRYQVAELDTTSGKVRYLTNGDAASGKPLCSPDGRRVLFETSANFDGSNPSGRTQLAELEFSSGRITYVTKGDDHSVTPAYSLSGASIVFVTQADNFEGAHTPRKDDFGNIAQIAEWTRASGKIRYLTDGDKPSLAPAYAPKGLSVVFQTQADNFTGTHTPRVEVDANGGELAVFQIALIKR